MIYTKVFQRFKGQFFILIISAVHIHSLLCIVIQTEKFSIKWTRLACFNLNCAFLPIGKPLCLDNATQFQADKYKFDKQDYISPGAPAPN